MDIEAVMDRRAGLMTRLFSTARDLADALGGVVPAEQRVVLHQRVASDLDAAYLHCASEALGWRPPRLSSVNTAHRILRARGADTPFLANLWRSLSIARTSAGIDRRDATASDAARGLFASIAELHAEMAAQVASRFGDPTAEAEAEELWAAAKTIGDRLEGEAT